MFFARCASRHAPGQTIQKMKKILIIIGTGIILSTGLIIALWIYSRESMAVLKKQAADTAEYDRYYVMISQDRSDLWQTVYESASETAREHNAILDWVGIDAPMDYTLQDCMRIATSSGVDGIILHQEASDDVRELIHEAYNAGIPVIMAMNDDNGSDRISYVGINSYQMGEIYAQQVLEALHEGENRVMILASPDDDGSMSLIYSQMLQVIENGKKEGQKVELSTHELNTTTSFDAEEGIRDIFIKGDTIPDVIVCLDLIATECVSQALVDYNKVGNVTVIGYYASDAILKAISKGLVKATLGINAGEIGQLCVEALDEYWTLGRASNYFNAGLSMITQEDALKLRSEAAEEIQDGETLTSPEGADENAEKEEVAG